MGKYVIKKKKKRKRRNKKIFLIISLVAVIGICTSLLIKKIYFSNSMRQEVVQAAVIGEKSNNIEKESINENHILKEKNVTEEGAKYAVDGKEVEKMINGKYENDGKKLVFLTFDDGPSKQNTSDILDILKEKDVKGTFFVVGKNIKDNKEAQDLLKRELKEGHAIGNHSYTHDFKKLYPNNKVDVEYFMKEIRDTTDAIKSVVGNEFDTKVIRMPGGHMSRVHYKDANLNNLNSVFSKEDFASIDWNSLNGDAEGKKYTNEEMLNYVKKTSGKKDKVIILMHDSQGKVKTKEILPEVIDYFKSNGYEFKTIM